MKKLLVLLFIFSISYSFSQNEEIIEPKYIYEIIHFNVDNEIVDLETQVPKLKGSYYKKTLVVDDPKSQIRFDKNKVNYFILNLGGNNKSIDGLVQFLKLDSSSKERSCVVNVKDLFGGDNIVDFTFEKYGKDSYRIVPADALIPGEYMINIYLEDATFVSLFGVD